MKSEPIVWVWFNDRWRRPVYEESDGRQFVIDDDGEKVYGVWYFPPDECAIPVIVDAPRSPEGF